MMKSNPHFVDVHVGINIRLLRARRGKSQTELAKALGITFQQVQKYEKGTNRISASRLYDAAQCLGVPVAFFFEGLDATQSNIAELESFSKESITIARLYQSVGSVKMRNAIRGLLTTVGDQDLIAEELDITAVS